MTFNFPSVFQTLTSALHFMLFHRILITCVALLINMLQDSVFPGVEDKKRQLEIPLKLYRVLQEINDIHWKEEQRAAA